MISRSIEKNNDHCQQLVNHNHTFLLSKEKHVDAYLTKYTLSGNKRNLK